MFGQNCCGDRGKAMKFTEVGQTHEFCESCVGHRKFTTLLVHIIIITFYYHKFKNIVFVMKLRLLNGYHSTGLPFLKQELRFECACPVTQPSRLCAEGWQTVI